MGDGVIGPPLIRSWTEDAGYAGVQEAEISSELHGWRRDPREVLRVCKERHNGCC